MGLSLPQQSIGSRSILQHHSRSLKQFWKGNACLIRKNMVACFLRVVAADVSEEGLPGSSGRPLLLRRRGVSGDDIAQLCLHNSKHNSR